jgi:peptide/nickel transport system substrate-binding protein
MPFEMKATALRRVVRSPVARLVAVLVALVLCVEVFASITWILSGAGSVDLAALEFVPAPERHPTRAKALHAVGEWPADRERRFQEAPQWAQLVGAGRLPPVSERLPSDPLVITPPHQMGPYGGTWRRYATGPSDIGILEARLAYDGLVRWGPMGLEVLPNLATRWDIEDGGRSFTFHMRRGVRWSDGHPFGADDILFWHRDVLQDADLTPVIGIEYRHGGELMKLEKLDDHTVRFRFAEPNGLFIKQLASNYSYTMVGYAAHYLKQFHRNYVSEEELDRRARAGGRDFWFQLFNDKREWRNKDMPRLWAWVCTEPPPARPARFSRNPYYWKVDPEGRQLPYIDHVTFDIYDIETINLKVINGEVGMQGRHVNTRDYPLFMANQKTGGYRVLHWIDGGDGTMSLSVNLNHRDPVLREIFGDHRLRKALSHALDRESLNEANFFGLGQPRQLAPPPVSAWYVEEYENAYIDFDPQEANRLLDSMGLDRRNDEGIRLRPDGEPLAIYLEMSSTGSGMSQLFEMVAADWTDVGIHTTVKMSARQLFAQRRNARLFDVAVWGGAGEIIPILDPRWFIPYNSSSFFGLDYAQWYRTDGRKGVKPPPPMLQALNLFGELQRTMDEQEQIRLFRQIIEINRQHLWAIGVVGAIPSLFIVKDNFRNVPEVAVSCWPLRTPGATAPECYAIDAEVPL